jgi:hypothetical protein
MVYTGEDGFEVGDADLTNGDGAYWVSGSADNGTLVGNDTAVVKNGTYSAKFNTAQAGGSAWTYHDLASGGNDEYFQFWLNVNAMTADNNTRTCTIATGRNTTTDRLRVYVLYQTANTFKLRLWIQEDGTTETLTGSTVLNTGTWYLMEVRYYCHASAGGAELWINGVSEISNLDNDTDFANNQVNRWYLGGNTGFNFTAATIYFDDVKDHTAYIGAGAPEINIKYDSTSIADGGTYSFGDKVAGTNTDLTFIIENTGTANLTLSGSPLVTIGGDNADQFSVQSQPTSPIAAEGNTTFAIRFSPTSAGPKTATIAIANNDADENPYNLTLTGNGIVIPQGGMTLGLGMKI